MSTNYRYLLDLTDVWEKAGKELAAWELAKHVASRAYSLAQDIKKEGKESTLKYGVDTLEKLSFAFEECRSVEHFNLLMMKLYDWADGEYVDKDIPLPCRTCWVATVIK